MVLNAENKKLGYVPEKDNLIFERLMDAGKLLKAKISKIEMKGSFRQIGVGIYLVDFLIVTLYKTEQEESIL